MCSKMDIIAMTTILQFCGDSYRRIGIVYKTDLCVVCAGDAPHSIDLFFVW